ncbi:3514_t:CDS:10, partial [Cetraspora pellucida]
AKCLSNVCIDKKSVSEVVATIVSKLCEHFKISLPKELSMNSLIKFARSAGGTSAAKPTPSTVQTPIMMLNRDLVELKHFKYNAELLCADQIGFKVAVSTPVARLGLSSEAYLQSAIADAFQAKAYLIKEGGYQAIKESLKKQFPIQFTVLTSSLPRGVPSQSHHKDDTLESDHFVLSWTLTRLLSDKFFDMLCDRMWFGCGWSGVEWADLKRNKDLVHDFLNNGELISEQIEECLAKDEEQHGVLTYLEGEHIEKATESTNRNFLLLVLRFLRRRILLSTKYCLTCHFPHMESVSSIRPFVCGTALCQHQALVGLGNLFEAVLVNSPVVVDLLISLCYVAISSHNLSPFPSRAIGITTVTKYDIQNSLVVDWDTNQGTIGTRIDAGYAVYGWKGFDCQVLENDNLEVYHPETGQPFAVNRCSHTTTVRVLEVTSTYLVTDFPIVVPISAVSSRHVYLPFRVYRRSEKNFLNLDGQPNYSLLQSVIDKLPQVNEMVKYAKKKILKQELDKLDTLCFPLLSWIISSNRTHLRLLESDEEKVQFNETSSAYGNWKQFIMIMSSPEKEETFQVEKDKLKKERRGQTLGELFAFHGSPLHNWHSIIRTSLNWKKVVHGRAFGDGVYHSLQAATSASYAGASYHRYETGVWKNSMLVVQKCMALCEIVNRPSQFRSTNPHLVIQDENWITTRYLFVECLRDPSDPNNENEEEDWTPTYQPTPVVPLYNMTPSFATSLSNSLSNVLINRRRDNTYITLDSQYYPMWFNNQPLQIPKRDFSIIYNELPKGSSVDVGQFIYKPDAQDMIKVSLDSETEEKNEDKFDIDDGDGFDLSLLPLPAESSKAATQRICRELRSIIHRQSEPSNDFGFTVNTEQLQSVYQWVVQLKDFDPSLPLAQDMARNKVKTIDLEVRFAPDYPFVPPYIRVIRPRLLRFMDGGGGHVTAGGSICMDLLTLGNALERGWSSVYTMEAVLLQVKMALSSLDPKPARLDRHWNNEYTPGEAIDSFIRVANNHNWTIPPQWSTLFGR